jgi:outer membrane protein assembly factor BamA
MCAQTPPECRKVVIERLAVEGANHLPDSFRGQLTAFLRRQQYSECADWVGDLESRVLRAENEGWPDRENEGYVGLAVGAEWKPLSEEAGLLDVSITIRVDEGQQKKLEKVEFRTVGAHSVPPVVAPIIAPEDLRVLIPLRDGEVFNQSKIREGLGAVARAYGARGFIECTVTSHMEVDQANQTVAITLDLNEGPLYRVGSLEIIGLDAATSRLLQAKLAAGDPVNPRVIEDFFADNKSRLPPGASPQAVVWRRDRQRAVVNFSFDFRTATAAHE